jgi:hypothetical protein
VDVWQLMFGGALPLLGNIHSLETLVVLYWLIVILYAYLRVSNPLHVFFLVVKHYVGLQDRVLRLGVPNDFRP